MPLPTTVPGLNAAGYMFHMRAHCRRCDAPIEFWWTPNKKLTPLDAGTLVSHFSTCKFAAEFRKKKAAK